MRAKDGSSLSLGWDMHRQKKLPLLLFIPIIFTSSDSNNHRDVHHDHGWI